MPEPSITISVRLPVAVYTALRAASAARGMAMNAYVIQAVEAATKEKKDK